MIVADVNGDGFPEVAQNGCGSNFFQPIGFRPSCLRGRRRYISGSGPGDFNGDGKAGPSYGYPITPAFGMTPLLGDGSETFRPGPVAAVGDRALVADFDGDGLSDFTYQEKTSTGSTALGIKLSNGDGTFRDGSHLECCSIGSNTGDFNGDGIPDVVTLAGEGGPGDVFLGQLDGSFVSSGTPLSYASSNQTVVADFDGNGSQDLAVLGYDHRHGLHPAQQEQLPAHQHRLVRVARTRRGRTASHLVCRGRQQARHANWQSRIQTGWNHPNHAGAERRRSSSHAVGTLGRGAVRLHRALHRRRNLQRQFVAAARRHRQPVFDNHDRYLQ